MNKTNAKKSRQSTMSPKYSALDSDMTKNFLMYMEK